VGRSGRYGRVIPPAIWRAVRVVQALETAPQHQFPGRTIVSLCTCLSDANQRLCVEAQRRGAAVSGAPYCG